MAIRAAASGAALARFAGKCLKAQRKANPCWETAQDDWAVGYFEGFLAHAEELRAG